MDEPRPTPDGTAAARRDTPRGGRTVGTAVGILALLAALATSFPPLLNGDVRYAIGGAVTAGGSGLGVSEIFLARPFAYRMLIGAVDAVRGWVTSDPSTVLAQSLVRVQALVVVALVGVLLHRALLRHADRRTAGWTALAVTASLAVAPPWHFMEPDWVGVVTLVLTVALGLVLKNPWLSGLLGGLGVMLTLGMKFATLPWVVIALVALFAASWKRALATGVAGGLLSILGYVVIGRLLPIENMWLNDQVAIVTSSPLATGVTLKGLLSLGAQTLNVGLVSPIVGTALAAAVVLVRTPLRGRRRWLVAAMVVVSLGMSLGSGYGQGEGFMYHFAATPVVAAALWGLAIGLRPGAALPLAGTTLASALTCAVLLARPAAWRADHLVLAAGIWALVALLGAVSCLWVLARTPSDQTGPIRGLVGGLALVSLAAALVVPDLPRSPYAFDAYDYTITNAGSVRYNTAQRATWGALRTTIGADTPVTYLTYGGTANFYLQNPTSCRYPSPQWIQRATWFPDVAKLPSYRDNLACLTPAQAGRYVVIQEGWFTVAKAPAEVQRSLGALFDCSPAARVRTAPKGYTVCPRRAG